MVRLVTLFVLVLGSFPFYSFGQQNGIKPMVIVIDPGHGGADSGAIGMNGILEKDVALNIAKEMESLSKGVFGESFEIYLTRNTDTLISLKDRATLAKMLNAKVLISLHSNHSGNLSAKGVEVYVPKNGEYLRASILLAYQIQKELRQNIGYKNRGVKFANFLVLRETVDYCPAVLVELGFLSNRDEAQHLTEDENVFAIALSLLSGINIKE